MKIKSFRGKIADEKIDIISLHTNDGSTGYRIVKFDIMPEIVNTAQISTVQLFSVSQTTATDVVDFNDNTLLGAATYQNNSGTAYPWSGIIFFDNMVFNQDIYVTHKETNTPGVGTEPINYYIELEQVKLDLSENTVATLKDIRNIKGQ